MHKAFRISSSACLFGRVLSSLPLRFTNAVTPNPWLAVASLMVVVFEIEETGVFKNPHWPPREPHLLVGRGGGIAENNWPAEA